MEAARPAMLRAMSKALSLALFLNSLTGSPLTLGVSAAPPIAEDRLLSDAATLDSVDVTTFADRFFAENLGHLHVPGATLAVVKDGHLLLAKGFGLSNLQTHAPVVAERTLFSVQSITKLFTVTAVMQAVERGLVGLDDDVNEHLKAFQVPHTFPEPILMRHLLTHTSGLEDKGIGIAARREADWLPLGTFLARSLPPRVTPPGQVMLYSDCGICLAGYAIESASGVALADFMERNILEPLGMARSRFLKLPPELAHDRAMGYSYERGAYVALPLDFSNIWPASSMMTTATDMARFMIMHLQDGRLGDVRILDENLARDMHRRHFSHHPRLAGVCYDFFEHFDNGRRAIGHTGAGNGFTSELLLFPDHKAGYFLATNAADPTLLGRFREAFFDRYFPATKPAPDRPQPRPATPVDRLTGWYWSNRYDRRTIEKVASLVGGYVRVSPDADGNLLVDGLPYAEIEPLLFHSLVPTEHPDVVFRMNASGDGAWLLTDFQAYERVSWYSTPPVQLGMMACAIVVLLSASVGWSLAYSYDRLRRRPSQQPAMARLARLWAGAAGAANGGVVLIVGFMLLRVELPSVATDFQVGLPRLLIATIACGTLSGVLSLGVLAFAALAWVKGYWSLTGRVHYSLVAVASLAYLWFCNDWNLIGLRY